MSARISSRAVVGAHRAGRGSFEDVTACARRRRYITFAYGQMHWSRLPLPDAMKHATAEAIRGAINDRIMEFG